MMESLAEFHWLRPWWFLALAPAIWLYWRILERHGRNPWRDWVDADLLAALTQGEQRTSSRWMAHGLLAAWLIAVAALAGPTWERLSQPLFQKSDALVVILDLGPSMNATDLKPSRIVQARRKISDLLDRRTEGVTALVVFGASAHVVVPLTDDVETIKSLLPVLQPSLMPVPGNRALAAVELGLTLMDPASTPAGAGRMLMLSDGVQDSEVDELADRVQAAGAELFVLGVGSVQGGPLPAPNGRQMRSPDGSLMIARLPRAQLRRLAESAGGVYMDMRLGDEDLDRLQPVADIGLNAAESSSQRKLDVWQDQGAWLALALLPMLAFAFRRGVLAALWLAPLALWPPAGHALDQDAWWRNQAQRDATRHDEGLHMYQAGDYESAGERFAETEQPHGHYNLGNALAKQGELEQAIDAYDRALTQSPRMEDALFNRALVGALLEQRQQQEQQQGGQDADANTGDSEHGESQGQNSQAGREDDDGSPSSAGESGDQAQPDGGDGERNAEQRPESGQPTDDGQEQDRSGEESDPSGERDGSVAETGESGEDNADSDQRAALRSVQEMRASERQQALMQWLRRLPDDSGALLKRKFRHQYREQQGRR